MKKRKPRPRPSPVADPMQPRVYQEPAAPDEAAQPAAPSSDAPPSAAADQPADAPPPSLPDAPPPSLPVALPAPPTATVPDPPPAPAPVVPPANPEPPQALEERLHRLEEMITSLRGTEIRTTPPQGPSPAQMLAGASQVLLPLAAQALQSAPDQEAVRAFVRREGSLFFEIYAEVRCGVRMFLDPRYRLGWLTRVVPPLALGCMIFAWFWLSGMPLVGPILDRLAFVVLLYIVYKVLGREALRYRMTSPDLPDSLRL